MKYKLLGFKHLSDAGLTGQHHLALLLRFRRHPRVNRSGFEPALLPGLSVPGDPGSALEQRARAAVPAQHLQLVLQLRQPALQPLDLFVPVGHHPLVLPRLGAVDAVQDVQNRVYGQFDGVFHHHRVLVAQMRVQSFVFDQIHPLKKKRADFHPLGAKDATPSRSQQLRTHSPSKVTSNTRLLGFWTI